MRIIGPHIYYSRYNYSIDSTYRPMHAPLFENQNSYMHAIRSPPTIQPRRVQIY